MSLVQDRYQLFGSKNLNTGEVLFEDYYNDELKTVLKEKIDVLCHRFGDNKVASKVSIGIGLPESILKKDNHGSTEVLEKLGWLNMDIYV